MIFRIAFTLIVLLVPLHLFALHRDGIALGGLADWEGNFGVVATTPASPTIPDPSSWTLMLIGMGLMKLGVVSGLRTTRLYAGMIVAGYGIGIPLNIYETGVIVSHGFALDAWFGPWYTYQLGRLAVEPARVVGTETEAGKVVLQWQLGLLDEAGKILQELDLIALHFPHRILAQAVEDISDVFISLFGLDICGQPTI